MVMQFHGRQGTTRFPLPSLDALHVFEVVARHSSFTRAAAELGVTQTAVSHRIKQLEHELGGPLFRRAPRSLSLTPSGRLWYAELSSLFTRLRDVNRKLRQAPRGERPVVSLTTIPSFGSRWLVPRLGGFLAGHPEIDLRISATEALVDFSVEPIDVGIRYGGGRYPGLSSEKLFEDAWLVVATPGLLARQRPRSPRDLPAQALLLDDQEEAWESWFSAHGVPAPTKARYTQFTDSGMVVEAALRGQGMALARWSLVSDELESGRLVRVFPASKPLLLGFGYHLVGPRENFRRKEIQAFRDWLRREVEPLTRVGEAAHTS